MASEASTQYSWIICHDYTVSMMSITTAYWSGSERYQRTQQILNGQYVSTQYRDILMLQTNSDFTALRDACTRFAQDVSDDEREPS